MKNRPEITPSTIPRVVASDRLIAGVMILIMPRLLNYIVAIYLIVVGLLGIFPNLGGCSARDATG